MAKSERYEPPVNMKSAREVAGMSPNGGPPENDPPQKLDTYPSMPKGGKPGSKAAGERRKAMDARNEAMQRRGVKAPEGGSFGGGKVKK